MKIGFIGLGIMGGHMAANLQAAGHDLVVHNRTKSKAKTLIANGATWADTPAEAATDVEILITMLAHPEAVEATAFGEDGFLNTLPTGRLWLDCSTVNPSFTRRMAAEADARGIKLIDAPVAGTQPQAKDAQLLFFAGATATEIVPIKPLLDVMGCDVIAFDEVGMGTSYKMVVNMLLATSMAAFAEAVALGRSLGLPELSLLEGLIGGPVTAPFLAAKHGRMVDNHYPADFPLKWMHKDLHLATTSAYETGATGMIASIAEQMFRQAIDAGHGDDDFSAIYAHLNNDA